MSSIASLSVRRLSLPLADTSLRISTSFFRSSTEGLTKPRALNIGRWLRSEELALPNIVSTLSSKQCPIGGLTARQLALLRVDAQLNMYSVGPAQPNLHEISACRCTMLKLRAYPFLPSRLSTLNSPRPECTYWTQVRSWEGVDEQRRRDRICVQVSR